MIGDLQLQLRCVLRLRRRARSGAWFRRTGLILLRGRGADHVAPCRRTSATAAPRVAVQGDPCPHSVTDTSSRRSRSREASAWAESTLNERGRRWGPDTPVTGCHVQNASPTITAPRSANSNAL